MIDSYFNMHFLHVMKKLAFFSKRAKFGLYPFLDIFFCYRDLSFLIDSPEYLDFRFVPTGYPE